MGLIEIRKEYDLTQVEAANILNIPVRTLIRYEKDASYGSEFKRKMMEQEIINKCEITETKGILTVNQIKDRLTTLFNSSYAGQIEYCYLFGSYSKGKQTEKSDVDLCVATSLTGLKFVALSEDIRSVLHKKIDLIRITSLDNNLNLTSEILKHGIKIYG